MPRPVSLSVDLLRTFLTLVRLDGDAMAAARHLGINQPSMSKRLSFLQHAGPVLARPWLVREGKTWKLTDEGERVRPAVEEIVSRYDLLRQFARERRPTGPSLAFACGRQMAVTLVRQAALRFRREQPNVHLHISTLRGETRIERVASGSLDLAIVTHDEAAIHDIARRILYTRTLNADPLVLACAAGTPWTEKVKALPAGRVKAKDLLGLPLVLPEPDAGHRKRFDQVLADKGLLHQLDVVLELGGWSALLEYVRDGAGVGIVSAEMAQSSVKGLVLRPLDPRQFPPAQRRLIARRQIGNPDLPDLTPPAQAFHDILIELAQPLPP
jgi:DNA-binding transcriptional LysR family regulator